MPGYYIHLASSSEESRKNRSFVYGLEAPDLLKKYYKDNGLEWTKEKYKQIKTPDMPDFSCFEARIQEKESILNNAGMHYGVSSNPDISHFWNTLSVIEKQNPFYIGYLWHLLTDLMIYKYLNIEEKLNNSATNNEKNTNLEELQKLHSDWDKINTKVRTTYRDVILTPEVIELNVVKFISDTHTYYVDWNIIKSVTDYLRTYNPLIQNIDIIIENIMNMITTKQNDASLNKKIYK